MGKSIEASLVAWMNGPGAALVGAPAYAARPSVVEGPLVTVERTGGSSDPAAGIDRAMVALRAWAPTRGAALDLMADILCAVPEMEGEAEGVSSASVNSVAHLPLGDIESYQATVDLVSYI